MAVWARMLCHYNPALRRRVDPAVTGALEIGHELARLVFNHRPVKEMRIHPAMQLDRIGEDEIAEIGLTHQPVLDAFIRLGRGVAHIEQVVVTEIRAVDRVEPRAVRIPLGVKGPRSNAVVALAAEKEIGHEAIVDVLRGFNPAMAPFVPLRGLTAAPAFEFRQEELAVEAARGEAVAILAAEAAEHLAIDIFWIDLVERAQIAFVPALIQRTVETDRPADAALLEGKFQRRETPRHATEKQRLADALGGRSEMADLVVHEIRDRGPHSPVESERMKRGSDLELDAFRPDRIVIV